MPGNIQTIPASVLESWPTPNYIDPVRRTWIIPYSCTLHAIATLMVGTRLWLRARQKAGALGLDDALLVPAWLVGTMFIALMIIGTEHYGNDRHTWDVPPTLYETDALIGWVSDLAFLVSTCCTKVSVLCFYRRLVHGTISKGWKYATIGAIIFTASYCLAFILVLTLNCRPTEAYWKAFSPTYTASYTCVDTPYLNPLSGSLSCFSDLYSVILPMAMLRHFDAPRRQKIALNVVFSLGLLIVAAGAVRTYYLYLLGFRYDLTWLSYDTNIWSTLEMELAMICASAPAMRVVLRKYLSDPISRALNTARSTGHRSANRDSRADTPGLITYRSHTRNSSHGSLENGEKALVKNQVKPSLDTVCELEVESHSPSTTPSELYVIKTPADFEAYALQSLERNRPPPRHNLLRPSSDLFLHHSATLSRPFTDWHTPPKEQY